MLSLSTVEKRDYDNRNSGKVDLDSLPKPQTENFFIIEVHKENDAIQVKCRVCALEIYGNKAAFRDLVTDELITPF